MKSNKSAIKYYALQIYKAQHNIEKGENIRENRNIIEALTEEIIDKYGLEFLYEVDEEVLKMLR